MSRPPLITRSRYVGSCTIARISASRPSARWRLLGEVVDQITRDLAHFLGQQRGAVDFGDAQRAVHRVQVLVALSQQRNVVLLLAECLETQRALR